VRWVKPDLVHALETQRSGYLCADTKALAPASFPPLMLTSWGNDLYLYGRLAEHVPKIQDTLVACDYFTADCCRDITLARKTHGFDGTTFPALPVAGGFDIDAVHRLRSAVPPSQRRQIVLKGYQHSAGRALDGLRAIELQMHSRARVSMGISISDGLPLAALEAALMGSMPIQSNTSCLGEHLLDGVNALMVPPEDPERIAAALRVALTDDDLVDRAATLNATYIEEHFNFDRVRSATIEMYDRVDADRRSRPAVAGPKWARRAASM
jgi:hypothetical protein